MSVDTENLTTPPTPAPAPATEAAPAAQPSPAAAPTEEQGGGIRRGRTSELLSRASFAPPAPTQVEPEPTEAHTEENVSQSLEAQPGTPAPASQPPAEDEVTRLRRENEQYQQRFQSLEAARQAAEVQQLTQTQQQELQTLTDDKAEAEAAYAEKYYALQAMAAEYQQAQTERDYETVEALEPTLQAQARELNVLYKAQQRAVRDLANKTTEFQTNYDTTRTQAQSQAVEAVAKKYGLTMDDLKKNAPDLKVTEYFKVLDTTAKTLDERWAAKYAALEKAHKELETKLRAEYRDQFDNSPGAQPHRLNGGTAGAHVEGIKAGNSGKLLEKAFKNLS